MSLTYFKRYRMEVDLSIQDWSDVAECPGYQLEPWDAALLDDHAEVKFHSFRSEIDANVFPCFNEREGCRRLMTDISQKEGFLPAATWMARYVGAGPQRAEPCGTIQGILEPSGHGSIQNVGLTPFHRGHGVGTRLIYRSLEGFQRCGTERVYLEVTAQNVPAIELYARLGFRKTRTLYKPVEVAYS